MVVDFILQFKAFCLGLPGTVARAACKNILQTESPEFSKAFVIAKSGKLKVEPGSTQSVSLPINYTADSTQFIGDCTGPTAPGHGGNSQSGPPVKIRVRLQDS